MDMGQYGMSGMGAMGGMSGFGGISDIGGMSGGMMSMGGGMPYGMSQPPVLESGMGMGSYGQDPYSGGYGSFSGGIVPGSGVMDSPYFGSSGGGIGGGGGGCVSCGDAYPQNSFSSPYSSGGYGVSADLGGGYAAGMSTNLTPSMWAAITSQQQRRLEGGSCNIPRYMLHYDSGSLVPMHPM